MKVAAIVERGWASPAGRFIQKYLDDNGPNLASLLAYNMLFSMFPIILAMLTLLGFVVRDPTVRGQVVSMVVESLPADTAEPILEVINSSPETSGWLWVVSFVGLLWGGSALFGTMEMAFDAIYGVSQRDFIRQRLMAVGMIALFSVLLLVAVLASSVATFLLQLSQQAVPLDVETIVEQVLPIDLRRFGLVEAAVGWVVSFVAASVLFGALYWVVPNCRQRLVHVLPSTVLAAALFVALTQLFPIYLRLVGGFNRYGAVFGLFLLLMTYFYFLGQILVLGAELGAFLARGEVCEGAPARPASVHDPLRPAAAQPPAHQVAGDEGVQPRPSQPPAPWRRIGAVLRRALWSAGTAAAAFAVRQLLSFLLTRALRPGAPRRPR